MWLRYSSSRQLTWQRNYNTQPRILGEAQARLTNAIAQVLPSSLKGVVHRHQDGHVTSGYWNLDIPDQRRYQCGRCCGNLNGCNQPLML